MADSSLVIAIELKDPATGIVDGAKQPSLAALANLFQGIASGAKRGRAIDIYQGSGAVYAAGTAIAAAVQENDTVTINGKALTATQHHARATCTAGADANAVQVDDTVTVNGVVFVAKAEPATVLQFLQDGTPTEVATSLAAKINAHPTLDGVVTAQSAAAVVTIRAAAAGTGGNDITLVSSNADRLAVTGSGKLTGGAAIGAEEFDFGGSNAETAAALALGINASEDAAIENFFEASNFSGSFTLTNSVAGDWVEIETPSISKRFVSATDFSVAGSDTQDAAELAAAINATPILNRDVFATSAAGAVYVHQRRGTTATVKLFKSGAPIALGAMASSARVLVSSLLPGGTGNLLTLASSNGTRLAVSGTKLSGGVGLTSVSKLSFAF